MSRNITPLRPDYSAARSGISPLVRAAFGIMTRAAVTPTTTTTGSPFGAQAVGDFVGSLAPISPAARLRNGSNIVPPDRHKSILIPRRSGSKAAADVNWISENVSIGARQYTLESVTLGPTSKLAAILALTRETTEHSAGEAVFNLLMREDLAASLDAAMFSNAAAAPPAPAGLLYGVTPITAASASTIRIDPLLDDLANLSAAICDAGGSADSIVYIAAARQAVTANLWVGDRGITVWPCAALATGTVIAIQADALATSFGEVAITETRDAPIVMNTVAAPFSTAGSPNVVASPIVSSFQADLLAVKVLLDCAWCMRAVGRVAVVTGVCWGNAPS